MTVWVCSHGLHYEGGGVEAVVGSYSLALEWLEGCRVESETSMARMREHVRTWRRPRHRPDEVPSEEEINKWRTGTIEADSEREGAELEDTSGYWLVRRWSVA